MSRRSLLALGCMTFLSVPALADGQAQPSCCTKPDKNAESTAPSNPDTREKLKCSLTGKVVDKCCCVERQGKTYCTLAKKSVEDCCCRPVASDAKEGK